MPADLEFPREKVGRTAGEVTSLEEQLVTSQAPEIAIYLRARTFIAGVYKQLTRAFCACPP